MKNSVIFIFALSLTFSSGLKFPYRNNSLLTIDAESDLRNFTIPCSDVDEIEWAVNSTPEAKNSVQVISPNEKNLVIEDVTEYDTGVYKCISKKNPNVFMKVVLRFWQ
ncbi:uncharacterized protein LOC135840350 [Planococcus citri]|uniref:uncharacterized protein LOC135840350 n=1 Tax=Planococcus citri TaxID=170843 RepID=UPI0031F9351D